MQYTSTYQSPVGEILLACDEIGLTGLWFAGEKFYALSLDKDVGRILRTFKIKKNVEVTDNGKIII